MKQPLDFLTEYESAIASCGVFIDHIDYDKLAEVRQKYALQLQPEGLAQMVTDHMIETQARKCLCCSANMYKPGHRLGKTMVQTLIKCMEYVAAHDKNMIVRNELDITHNQDGNWSKLKNHALIAKYKEDGKHVSGRWLITHRAALFLRGEIQIPEVVYTWRGKVVERSEKMVSVSDIMGGDFYCDTRETLFWQPVEAEDIEQVKVHLKKKSKKRKNPCPNCDKGELKRRVVVDETIGNNVRTHDEFVCNACKHNVRGDDAKPTA